MWRFQDSAQSAPQRRTQLGSTTSRRSCVRCASSWSRSSTTVMRERAPVTGSLDLTRAAVPWASRFGLEVHPRMIQTATHIDERPV